MTIQWSTAVRNARLDAIETAIGTSAVLKIRTGAPPASCGAADSGSALISYSLASDWAAGAAAGSKNFNNMPLTGVATGTGTAGHYRIYASDGITCHEQGTVTVTIGGGDMTVDNTSINAGQTINVTAFLKTEAGA